MLDFKRIQVKWSNFGVTGAWCLILGAVVSLDKKIACMKTAFQTLLSVSVVV